MVDGSDVAAVVLAKGAVEGASAFMSRICLPAAEEFGLLLKDVVQDWRKANFVAMARRAERILVEQNALGSVHAHPRLASHIIEEASWIDDSVVRDMWAGLLASSCTESGDDDSNLLFTTLLSQMTKVESRIMKYACEKAEKVASPNGLLIVRRDIEVSFVQLQEIAEEKDVHRLDRELDHLIGIGLLRAERTGFSAYDFELSAGLGPTPLALQMYARCCGSSRSPLEFYGIDWQPPKMETEPPPPSPS